MGIAGSFILIANLSRAQEEWPKAITAADGTVINIYQPQAEFFAGNTLKSRSAFSVLEPGSQDPIFGVFWSTATVETDRDTRQVAIEAMRPPLNRDITFVATKKTTTL